MSGELQEPNDGHEIDPIKDAFVEDGIAELLRTPINEHVDPIDDAVNRGLLTDDDAATFRSMREKSDEEKLAIARGVADALQIAAEDARRSQGDSLFGRYLRGYFENMAATDGEGDFVPFKYLKDDESGKNGMTLDEWNELPQSTKDTLRDVRFNDSE